MAFIEIFAKVWVLHFIRYVLLGGLAALIYKYLICTKWPYLKLQLNKPQKGQVRREWMNSLSTTTCFALVSASFLNPWVMPHTLIYTRVTPSPLWWLLLQVPVLTVLNDTYFYWMHRLVHHPLLFKPIHKTHHLSTHPTAWTSYSFSVSEAFLEIVWIVPVVFLIPLRIDLLILYGALSVINNVRGHLNFEIIPLAMRQKGGLFSWVNTTAQHNDHHRYFNGNYGLYFNFWDRVCGTWVIHDPKI